MTDFLTTLCTRHAIRRYQPQQVPRPVLEQILQAGLHAPSAGNNQYSRIVVCQDRQINARLGRMSRELQFQGRPPAQVAHPVSAEQPSIQDDFTLLDGFYGAPTVLHLFTRSRGYAREDAAMMAENLMLAAHSLGLGSCYIGRAEALFATPYGQSLRAEWGIPEDMTAGGHVLLGHRDGPAPGDKPRKPGRILWIGAEADDTEAQDG